MGSKKDSVAAGSESGRDQLVAVLDLHGEDAARIGIREFSQPRLFDDALTGDQGNVAFGGANLALHVHVLALLR